MNQTSRLELSFRFVSSRSKNPIISLRSSTAGLDQILEHDGELVWTYELPMGEHCLTLCLINKEPSDTVLVENQIKEDLYVVLEGIKLDGIDMKHKLNEISRYLDTQGQDLKTFGWMSFRDLEMQIFLQCPAFMMNRNVALLKEDYIKYIGHYLDA